MRCMGRYRIGNTIVCPQVRRTSLIGFPVVTSRSSLTGLYFRGSVSPHTREGCESRGHPRSVFVLIRRSTLILPVNVPRFAEKAHLRGADADMLDLADAVPPPEKAGVLARLA